MDYRRAESAETPPERRVADFAEFHTPLPEAEQRRQAARCMDCGVPFCQSGVLLGGMVSGCPLHNLIPEWNDLVYQGRWELALRRLLAVNRFAEFTGRVCPAPCEAACTCGMASGSAVCIKENERAIIEYGYANGLLPPCPPPARTGKRVAVVGSGPSGLAAADWLNKRGHAVTVYERSDRPGGLLMYGIPNMKLDKAVVLRRTRLMEAEGVAFALGCEVGRALPAKKLLEEYDAVLLCCGAAQPRDLTLPGRQAAGIHFAVEYLAAATKTLLDAGPGGESPISAKGRQVLVIGGGDTGNDCVATAIRQGCAGVVQLEMLPKPPETRAPGNAWPEWPRVLKTDYGQQEAIALFGAAPRRWQATVKEFLTGPDGRVAGAVVQKLAPGKPDKAGRRPMEPTGEEYTLPAGLVLIAAGFTGCEPGLASTFGAELDPRGRLAGGENPPTAGEGPARFYTGVPKLFAAGDARRGQSLVVWALREGRDAAAAVDEALMGYTNL